MPNADSIDDRRARSGPVRPLVLVVLDDDEVRARFAYLLTAFGFDVAVTGVAPRLLHAADRPDVIVAALSPSPIGGGLSIEIPADDPCLEGVPVVAVAGDASGATRELARRKGCAAVCVAT